MLYNYLKLGLRNLIRRRVYSLISIGGLSVGLATAFIVMAYVLFEGTYNRGIVGSDRIYQVLAHNKTYHREQAMLPYVFGAQVAQEVPGIESMTCLFGLNNITIKRSNNLILGNGAYCADTSVFKVFGINLIEQSNHNVLGAPNTVAISKLEADKLFPDSDPIGQLLTIVILGKETLFTVVGVFADLPENTTLKFNYLFNIGSVVNFYREFWISTDGEDLRMQELLTKYDNAFSTFYFKLSPNTSIAGVEQSLTQIQHRYLDKSEDRGSRGVLSLYLLPFTQSYYYNPENFYDFSLKGNKMLLYMLIFTGFFILFIGVSSYVILFTALSTLRFREIGLRKVVGANRASLLLQSIVEAMLTCILALVPTFMLVEFVRPLVNGFSGKTIIGHYWSNPMLMSGFILLVLLVGLIAGFYTFYGIIRFNPIAAMKGGVAKIRGKSRIRFALIVLQLAIFIALTVATIVLNAQLRYVTALGIKNSGTNLYLVSLATKPLQNAYPILKQELKALPWVEQVSGSITIPPSNMSLSLSLKVEQETDKEMLFHGLYMDAGFAELLNMKLVEGSYLTGPEQAGGKAMLITESAAKLLNMEHPIGYTCGFGTVVGVVKGFPTQSAKFAEEPLLLIYGPQMVRWLAIKVDRDAPSDSKSQIAQLIKTKVGDVAPEITTMEEHVAELYSSERKLSVLLSIFALVSISLAVMGLFGLSLFTLEQRTKEIGLRKISGASIARILQQLFLEYAWLVLVALFVAVPLSWLVLQKWLNSFAYHTSIHWWYYLLAALFALALVMLSIFYQAMKVATRSPINSLRYE